MALSAGFVTGACALALDTDTRNRFPVPREVGDGSASVVIREGDVDEMAWVDRHLEKVRKAAVRTKWVKTSGRDLSGVVDVIDGLTEVENRCDRMAVDALPNEHSISWSMGSSSNFPVDRPHTRDGHMPVRIGSDPGEHIRLSGLRRGLSYLNDGGPVNSLVVRERVADVRLVGPDGGPMPRTRKKELPPTCPHCQHVHAPATLRRLDSEKLQCIACRKLFPAVLDFSIGRHRRAKAVLG